MARSEEKTFLREKLQVVAAVIRDGLNRVLLAQRSSKMSFSGKWEFPGGKIRHGETPKDALKREILEELGVSVDIREKILSWRYSYDFADIDFIAFDVIVSEGVLKPLEHQSIVWEDVKNIAKYDWLPADLELVNKLLGG